MRRGLVSLLLVLGTMVGIPTASLQAASTWPMQGHDPLGTNANTGDRMLTPATIAHLHQAWSYPHVFSVIATESKVYAITSLGPLSSHRVVSLNARTGGVLRVFNRAVLFRSKRAADAPQALAYAGGRLIVAADGATAAINPDTGRVSWRVSVGANSLTVVGETIYGGALCESRCTAPTSYALNLQTGHILWQHRENGGEQPMLIAGHLFQTWQPNTRVYDQQTGHLLATLPLQAQWLGDGNNSYAFVSTPPALASPKKVTAWVGRIGPTGKPIWKVSLGIPADPNGDGQAALSDHTLYVPSNRFHPGVVAVNAANGKVRWGADIGSRFTLVVGNRLLFAIHALGGRIDVLDTHTGRVLRQFTLPPGAGGAAEALVAGGTLYMVGGAGLAALRS